MHLEDEQALHGLVQAEEQCSLVNAGDELDGVRVSENTVVIAQGHQIGDMADSDEVAPWAMDLAKCFGVGSVGLVSL